MSRNILLILTAACCLFSISPLHSLSHNSPSISSGLHQAIFAYAKPIQILVRSNNEHTENAFSKETNQIARSTTDRIGNQATSTRHAKHNLAYDAILHSESQIPVFWNNHPPDWTTQTKNAKKSASPKPYQVRKTHGKNRTLTVKSFLASIFGNRASTTSSPPSIASSVKKVTKSDPLRKPASDAKTQQLAQKQEGLAKVALSAQPNVQGQTTSKPKKKKTSEALAMMAAAAIGKGASAFETPEAICDDSDNDNFIKQAMHQLTHDGQLDPQSDESRSASDTMSVSENDSSILNRKITLLLHQRDVAQEEQVSKQEQDQVESALEESEPTFLSEEDLEEEGILESLINAMVGPSPLNDQDRYPIEDQNHPHSSHFQDWIQYMDRKGAATLTAVLATLVHLDPSTWSGPQVAIAFTFATFVALVLLALYISYKMHRRRERFIQNGGTSCTSSSLSFFHYLTGGIFNFHRHQRHTFADLSPFSKEAYFTLPTHRDTKSSNVAPEPSYATTSASVAGANRSEIRRTSVARQMSISQAQAVLHARASMEPN